MLFKRLSRLVSSGLKKLTSSGASKVTRPRRSTRLSLEHLEERAVPAVLMVTNLNDNGAGSLRAEIQAASSGDTIQFASSLAGGTVQLTSGELDITKNLTINGAGTGVAINAGGHSRVFEVESGVTANLNFLTIADGNAGGGGGIFNFGTLNVAYSTFTGNEASVAGGAIDNVGTLTINASSFLSNTSGWGGAINNASGSALIDNSTFASNYGFDPYGIARGGAIANNVGTSLAIENSTLAYNQGYGIYNLGYTLMLGDLMTCNTYGDLDNVGSIDPGSADNMVGGLPNGGLSAANGNLLGISNTGLGALGYYGGPTETFALLPQSPAVGHGLNFGGTDQRGFVRPSYNGDIGAFQTQHQTLCVNPQNWTVSYTQTSGFQSLGQFGPDSIDVNTTLDTPGAVGLGQMSLRDAVNLADLEPQVNDGAYQFIYFDAAVFTQPQTIQVTAGSLPLGNAAFAAIYGPTGLTLTSNEQFPVFTVASGNAALLSNLNFSDSQAVVNSGNLGALGCTFSGGSALFGGAIANYGQAGLYYCTFSSNWANTGGAIFNEGTLTASNDTFQYNSAYLGGAIANYGTLTDSSDTYQSNSAIDGGAIYTTGTVTGSGDWFNSNSAYLYGGAVFAGGSSNVTLNYSTFSGNSANLGPAVFAAGSSMSLSSDSFWSNSASQGGSFYYASGALYLSSDYFG